ncbi:MAG: DEAD/DEAH box helicase family protein [Kiritimatiellae bacterium]|nr:DEAD/DEAH box helicase family protein [Kiritimatiellia bacterium]
MSDATLNDLKLKPQYRTNPLNPGAVVEEFYIPILEVARKYDRISGFFSSASLCLAARGIAALIEHGGKMRLVCSPNLPLGDCKVFKDFVYSSTEDDYNKYLNENFRPDESSIQKDHLAALGWMLANGFLEVKLAIPNSNLDMSMCHPKIGLVEDMEGNAISFSGSNNETVNGWAVNQEEFKVFSSVENTQYYENDRMCFDWYWNNIMPGVKCVDLPEALRQNLLKRADEFNKETYIAKHYVQAMRSHRVWSKLNLRDYQNEAISKWEKNNYSLMFEMATGSGKTRTALGCINRFMEKEPTGCVVVAAPRLALCDQWRKESQGSFLKDAKEIEANSDHKDWNVGLARQISRIVLGTSASKYIVVYTSHKTASSLEFLEMINRLTKSIPLMLVADEAHGLGARQYQRALYEKASYRVGLSATPTRMFDDIGTEKLVSYFGNASFEFSIGDALLAGFVSPYRYYPILVKFTRDENDKYDELTERIRKLRLVCENNLDEDAFAKLEDALRKRALLVAAAQGKLPALRKILQDRRQDMKKHAIAFTCPDNIDAVVNVYLDAGLMPRKYTSYESTDKRKELLVQFAEGSCSALVAMKCLDEGVDIPAAKYAMLISSTVNPREYIQRIGRVIRKSSDKEYAEIYDFLVVCNGNSIVERDLNRALYIVKFADNATSVLDTLYTKTGV